MSLARDRVEDELVERERLLRGRRLLRAAQYGLHPHHELARGERLRDIVVGADLETDDAVVGLATGGEHDHRKVAARADPAAQREPVGAGQHQVEHDELQVLGREKRAGGVAVPGLERVEALTLEVADEDVADEGLVVDDEDGGHELHCHARGSLSPSTHLRVVLARPVASGRHRG